jgi:hypothetical protein
MLSNIAQHGAPTWRKKLLTASLNDKEAAWQKQAIS